MRTHLLKRSMLKKTYSPLSKPSSVALIMISRTESGEAHKTTTATEDTRISKTHFNIYMFRSRAEQSSTNIPVNN